MTNPSEILKTISPARKKENAKFLNELKRKTPRNLDNYFHAEHYAVFENIDCLTCANCCKTTSPIFYEKDIDHLSKRLRIKPGEFIEKFLKIDEDNDYVLKSSPCIFLGNDNYCSVYDDRPTACKEYPHTNRKNMYQVLDLALKNTTVCPAVLMIIEKLKNGMKK